MSEYPPDRREVPRFVLREPLRGRFGRTGVTLINISVAGALIELTEKPFQGLVQTLVVGDEEHPGKVIWIRLEKGPTGGLLYRAGLQFTEPAEALVSRLVRTDAVFPPEQPTESLSPKERAEIARINAARDHFLRHPEQIAEYSRPAREGGIAKKMPHRDEVFAIWEYLERGVDLELIKRLLQSQPR